MRIKDFKQSTAPNARRSLAWLLASTAGNALAAIVVAGVVAGRLGVPIVGSWLLGAGLLGALPRLLTLARGGWAARWAELAAALIGFAAIGGVGIALAWPALLPLGFSVDAVHHTQLIAWMADHRALPSPSGDIQGLLGEMTAYPVGLALVVLATAAGSGRPLLEATYPTVALIGGLIAATVVLISSAAARGELKMENEQLKSAHAKRSFHNFQFSIFNFLALLAGPLLILAHRSYLMEAYIDHSYYTMVLGILLVLLAAAWLLVEPPGSLATTAQFGLVLAALMCTYPLWAPVPATLAFIVIVNDNMKRRQTIDDRRLPPSSIVHRPSSIVVTVTLQVLVAFIPALALALLDVLPRMRVGQTVLAHEGLVTLPTAQRLTPILLALPCAVLLARGRQARGLVGLAALVALAIGALALAARGGLVAVYHSYKLLFVLTPLAAAIVGAALARLVAASPPRHVDRRPSRSERKGLVAVALPIARSTVLAPSADTLALARPNLHLFTFHPPIHGRRQTAAASPIVDHRASSPERRLRLALLVAAALVLALTGSFRIIPPPAAQVITPDMVAAARWLRANAPRDAAKAIAVGAPAGLTSYWQEVGLLGQRRDKAAAAQREFTIAPPSHESWLVDRQLPAVAIAPAAEALPGESILARFGDLAVVRRAAELDTALLNPLLIRYRSFWEDGRLKTTLELQRTQPGPLPLLELRLYHAGAPIASYALPPEQGRTRPQYLGADLLPSTLGAEGYVNQSAYPVFDPPALAPTGALSLTLRLTLAGASVEERQLASFERAADGRFEGLALRSGELIYLRHEPATGDLRAAGLEFGGALRLTGWGAPAQASAGDQIAVGLRWQTPQALDRSLFPELVLLDQAGQPVAASLCAPQDGFYPTWRWRPGESVAEQRRLQLPAELAPGVYRIAVRVHDFAAGRTLDVRAGAEGLAQLGEIVVESGG